MKRIVVLAIIISIVSGGVYGLYRYMNTRNNIFSEKTIFTAKEPITASVVIGDEIALGTCEGNINTVNLSGNEVWHSKINSSIFGIEKDTSDNLLVCGVYFYLFDKTGKQIFAKGFKNYLGVKGKFLENNHIVLLFQSLTDLSYLAVTTDRNGKTISTRKIPDIGESSSISITSDGKFLFVGSRGEIYLLDQSGIEKSMQIDNENGNLHYVYGFILPGGNIVCGYRLSTEKNVDIPVYFYTKDFKKVKTVKLHSSINNVIPTDNGVVFATKEGFIVLSQGGDTIGRKTLFGFSAIGYAENETSELFVYTKNLESNKEKIFYSIILAENGKENMKFLFESETMPSVLLDSKSDAVFVINKDKLDLLYKQ